MGEVEAIQEKIRRLTRERDEMATQAGACAEEVDRVRVEIGSVRAENDRLRQGRDDAMKAGIRAGIEAAIRGIDATVLNMGSDCDRRGGQDRTTGEVPCEGEEERGCACSEALEIGARLIRNLRTADVEKIAAMVAEARS